MEKTKGQVLLECSISDEYARTTSSKTSLISSSYALTCLGTQAKRTTRVSEPAGEYQILGKYLSTHLILLCFSVELRNLSRNCLILALLKSFECRCHRMCKILLLTLTWTKDTSDFEYMHQLHSQEYYQKDQARLAVHERGSKQNHPPRRSLPCKLTSESPLAIKKIMGWFTLGSSQSELLQRVLIITES